MGKKDFKYKVEEVIETLSGAKDKDWGKFIIRARYDDKPSTIDIRKMKFGEETVVGRGISLTDDECDTMVNSLAKKGYGSAEVFEEEIKRRKKMYGFSDKEDDSEVG
jgi:hypothetical protein